MTMKNCLCGCGQLTNATDERDRPRQGFIHGHNWKGKQRRRGKYHYSWKGGRRILNAGYIGIWKPDHPRASINNCVFEHILVYEQYHNCCVLKWGNIHHINGKKDDNRPENLKGMTRAQHTILHRKGKPAPPKAFTKGHIPWNKGLRGIKTK